MNPQLGMLVAAYDRQKANVGPLGDWMDTLSDVGQKIVKAAGGAVSEEIHPSDQSKNLNQLPSAGSKVPWGWIVGGVAVFGGVWWWTHRKPAKGRR